MQPEQVVKGHAPGWIRGHRLLTKPDSGVLHPPTRGGGAGLDAGQGRTPHQPLFLSAED